MHIAFKVKNWKEFDKIFFGTSKYSKYSLLNIEEDNWADVDIVVMSSSQWHNILTWAEVELSHQADHGLHHLQPQHRLPDPACPRHHNYPGAVSQIKFSYSSLDQLYSHTWSTETSNL